MSTPDVAPLDAYSLAFSDVRVESIEAGSPAHAAGVKPGDVIVAFDDTNIVSVDELQRHLVAEWIGRELAVKVNRRAAILRIAAPPGERAGPQKAAALSKSA